MPVTPQSLALNTLKDAAMKLIIQLTLIICFLDGMILISFLKLEKYPITC